MTKVHVKCPQVQTDRRWPFCRPSWLSFIDKNGISLIKAIHIRNLEEIRLQMTKLE